MPALVCLFLLAYVPVTVLQTEVTLEKGRGWTHDFMLAPGDSLRVQASCLRQVGSSCGCLAGVGDVFLRKGDNVGKAALSEWRGGTVTSAYEQCRPEIAYYTDKGGAYTLSIENHSGHRTNVYAIAATRIPTVKKYAKFDASFKADTAFETTWVEEPVYRTVKDTSYVKRTWTDTLYTESQEGKHGSTTLYRGILGSNKSEVPFSIPSNSTGKVGFALFTDLDKLRELQAEAKAKCAGVGQAASAIPNPYAAAAGIALQILGPVSNSGDGAFHYWVIDEVNRGYYNADIGFRCYEKGENVSNALFACNLAPGQSYYLELKNTSFMDKAVVAYEMSWTVREPRYENHSKTEPVVKARQEQTGTRRVPRVEQNVAPHLPWKTRD